jgi:glucose-1-phosphate thymidylyltransferase
MLEANRVVLDEMIETNMLGEMDSQSRISGRVQVGKNSKLVNCTVRGPAVIGRTVYLKTPMWGPSLQLAMAPE